ncbi:extracellular serine/threonine protein kinase four-jointed [Anopheles aquasalis]|uniref:extracellular serine/threonine protein kinase four-jointed n=1 Tax=Anopheles aquasalis TaxID=42839 RepID=UPI00215B5210|nr:extracellular serine/threonine protein kinase four-jointed [Anopheles aquasalis]
MFDVRTVEAGACCDQERDSGDGPMSITARRRRAFQRQACLLSVMAAFSLGLALGVFVPLIGISQAASKTPVVVEVTNGGRGGGGGDDRPGHTAQDAVMARSRAEPSVYSVPGALERQRHEMPHFPTIDDIRKLPGSDGGPPVPALVSGVVAYELDPAAAPAGRYASVSFIAEDKLATGGRPPVVDRDRDPADDDHTGKRSIPSSSSSIVDQMLAAGTAAGMELASGAGDSAVGSGRHQTEDSTPRREEEGVIQDGIYWGSTIERALPTGFDRHQSAAWTQYLRVAQVDRLEIGCGRMQNRMLVFRDGTRACARYRQNTDQIQGELFSFYLGQLLNLTNLAPSAASIIDLEARLWSTATDDLSSSQWKPTKPVVITKWIGNLEPAGIPKPFQPLERHLNRYDVRNITEGLDRSMQSSTKHRAIAAPVEDGVRRLLLDRLAPAASQPSAIEAAPSGVHRAPPQQQQQQLTPEVLERLVELAQWSDLIVFDYLIANLDRVVNNLYNFQWNADIMAAPAHNLARQTDSALLVFLDNESGLLHGYRLLKKYEAYHGLLLDNLCVYRRSTVEALEQLRAANVGRRLNALFERTTTAQIRDVLPPLPEKSVKILVDRIDRVLGQVQKCRELFASNR